MAMTSRSRRTSTIADSLARIAVAAADAVMVKDARGRKPNAVEGVAAAPAPQPSPPAAEPSGDETVESDGERDVDCLGAVDVGAVDEDDETNDGGARGEGYRGGGGDGGVNTPDGMPRRRSGRFTTPPASPF